jgi:uncharacterized protein (DUF885 family)
MANEAFSHLLKSYLDLRWHFDPVDASAAGLTEHDERLGTFGAEEVREHVVALKAVANALEALQFEELDDEIDRTALLNEIRVTVHRFVAEQPHVKNPAFWLSHLLEGIYLLLVRQGRSRAGRIQAIRCRLEAIPGFLEAAKATFRDCSQVFVTTAMDIAEGGLVLLEQLPNQLRVDSDEDFSAARASAIAELRHFVAHLDDLRSDADGEFAVGEEAFNFRLHYQHASQNNASELWRYGVTLAEEVDAQLEELGKEIGGNAGWPDLVERLRGTHPSSDALVSVYDEEMNRARRFVEERGLAAIPPGELQVVESPPFLQPLIPFAAYQPPGFFANDRTGLFYVSSPDGTLDEAARRRLLRDHCSHEIPVTALHEGYPGHHLHFLMAQAQPRTVRKFIGTPLTYEGWALYCEDMMGEEGFYRSVEERLFQRLALLWRAVRVVVDVGLHTRGMTFEQAVQILVDRLRVDRSHAEAEIRRYCAEPAYQLCYAVGRRDLKALRCDFQQKHGSDYTVRSFHEAVLRFGGLPVSLMRWGMGL